MKIQEVITKNYEQLRSMCRNTNIVVSCHKTSEDVFQDVMVMALNKFKKKEITEEVGMDYLVKSLLMEFKFQWKKFDNVEVYMDEVKECPTMEDL